MTDKMLRMLLATLLLGTFLPTLCAQVPEDVVNLVNLQVHTALKQALNELVDEEEMARHWGVQWPLPEPTPIPEVEAAVKARLEQEAMERFPPDLRERFRAEAQEKFKPFTRGEMIEVRLTDGSAVTGHLREVDRRQVQVAAHTIPLERIERDCWVRFWPTTAAKRMDEYVKERLVDVAAERDEFRKLNEERVRRELYRQHGYVRILGEWIPERAYFEQRVEEHREQLAARLRPLLEDKHFWEHGWVRHEGAWINRAQAEEIRRREYFDENEIISQFEALDRDEVTSERAAEAPFETDGDDEADDDMWGTQG